MMMIREARRQTVEDNTFEAMTTIEADWISARDLSLVTGRSWQSTARALLRMVTRGRVRQQLLYWRDKGYRPRTTRIYQAVLTAADITSTWPEWMRLPPAPNRGAPTRPPKLPRTTTKERSNDEGV